MSSGGFIVNTTAPTAASFALTKLFKLAELVSADANSLHGALPSQARLEQVDVQLTLTAGGPPTQAKVMLYWDSAGDDPMAGPSAYFALTAALTTANLYVGTANLGRVRPRAPAGQTASGTCYAAVLVDAGTVTVTRVRLHWSDPRDGE